MKKSFGNCVFLGFGIIILFHLFIVEGGFIQKIIGFGAGMIFTLMLMILFLVFSPARATDYEGINSVSISATSGSYTTANTVTWETQEFFNKAIVVTNDETNDATMRIRTRSYYDGDWVTLQEGTLSGNGSTMVTLNNWYFDVEIAVKDDSSGDHTAISIQFGGKI